MQKQQVVFVPAPGAGHMLSMLEFANRILERDQRISVTVLIMKVPSSGPTPITAPNPNIRFIQLPQVDPIEPQLMQKSIEKAVAVFIENHKSVIKQAIIDHILSKSIPLAGLVIDLFCSSMVDLAKELGVPSYLFFTSAATFLGLVLQIPVHYTRSGREFDVSDPDWVIPAFVNPLPTRVLPYFLFNKDGGYESFKNHGIKFKETNGIFINTFLELESHAIKSLQSDIEIPPIYTVGPLLKGQNNSSSPNNHEKLMKWLDDQPLSSVLFLCFGSMGGLEPPQLAQIAIALEKSGQRFLWSIRRPPSKDYSEMSGEFVNFSQVLPKGFLERTENRGFVCGWAPQVEILAHKAVGGFVSHCGWNSILESLWNGVPIATWPLGAEQQMNAFYLVKELKLAVELKIDYRSEYSDKVVVMADEIEKAITSLMDTENPVRMRVKEMSEISRKAQIDGGSSFISMGKLIEDVFVNKI
ncbi:hypothetical protein M9H77_27517 [Catharanthus roseus]|uniref:Uncharacterized protein n=1 Tax=Catharanthus roseus TaxID=4058 RepID=A0ACC0AEV7_CATRO|nr:hypothetical protein M9H77_27517 [Catharanthus roseus]